MSKPRPITASMEDYLEAIFHIAEAKGAARAKDIAERLNVKHASVTGALQTLAGRGLVNYAPYDVVTLTQGGREVAADVVRRHEVLRDFFTEVLAVDAAVAEEGACKLEHGVPRLIVERLTRYGEFLKNCPRAGAEWLRGFDQYCAGGRESERCERCVDDCLKELKERVRQKGETLK